MLIQTELLTDSEHGDEQRYRYGFENWEESLKALAVVGLVRGLYSTENGDISVPQESWNKLYLRDHAENLYYEASRRSRGFNVPPTIDGEVLLMRPASSLCLREFVDDTVQSKISSDVESGEMPLPYAAVLAGARDLQKLIIDGEEMGREAVHKIATKPFYKWLRLPDAVVDHVQFRYSLGSSVIRATVATSRI